MDDCTCVNRNAQKTFEAYILKWREWVIVWTKQARGNRFDHSEWINILHDKPPQV